MSKLISYSHNLEDVLLQRAFVGVERGFYVDVGASWPCETSNTWALYQRGWSGVVVDPLIGLISRYEEAWQRERPRDVLVKAAAGAAEGHVQFYVCTSLQLSTGSRRAIDRWVESGSASVNEATDNFVPVVRLDSMLIPTQDIHLLAIDVEGMEGDVLAGLDLVRYRPWVIVAESIEGAEWEPLLLDNDYDRVHEDGSSRFYLAREHSDLRQWFRFPPHVLEYVTWRELKLQARVQELESELAKFFLGGG